MVSSNRGMENSHPVIATPMVCGSCLMPPPLLLALKLDPVPAKESWLGLGLGVAIPSPTAGLPQQLLLRCCWGCATAGCAAPSSTSSFAGFKVKYSNPLLAMPRPASSASSTAAGSNMGVAQLLPPAVGDAATVTAGTEAPWLLLRSPLESACPMPADEQLLAHAWPTKDGFLQHSCCCCPG